MNDVLVVGSGFAGGVVARQLAEKYNKNVRIIEKREHIGGNMFEEKTSNGVFVHKYGPHIFHTNSQNVMDYMKKFGSWRAYEHKVLGKINNKYVPIPFNFKSLDQLFSKEKADVFKGKIKNIFDEKNKVFITDLLNSEDNDVIELGQFIFKNVFENYTAKQWQIPANKIDKSVLNRVPVVLGYEDGYFIDKYQYMPENGYNEIFNNLLNHTNIKIDKNCDALQRINLNYDKGIILFDKKPFNGNVIFTGEVDYLFGYIYGYLPYRSLNLKFEEYSTQFYQVNSVINYPNEEKFTRITEFKYLTGQKSENTTILKEYPVKYNPEGKIGNIPYYPILNETNLALYNKYLVVAEKFDNLYLCGRLAEYKYYNMDQVIERAILIADRIGVQNEKH